MVYWICFVIVVVPLAFECVMVMYWREKIPLRVHVHGTRGKSSTVRGCAQLLREQGLAVLAKTTGDAAEYILPDGRVEAVRRIGPARIREHVATLRKAARLGADVVVAEGMALAPENVWQSENILRATHAIITNTRPDHAECMGSGRNGVIRTLGLMIPEHRELFTTAEEGVLQLAKLATQKHCSVTMVGFPESCRQPDCLASAAAGALLAEGRVPLWYDFSAEKGPEWAAFLWRDTPLRFLDLFSTNDVESSALLWKQQQRDPDWLRVVLLATRADRPLRTRDLLNWLLAGEDFDLLVAQGGHAGYVWLRAGRGGRLLPLTPWRKPGLVMRKLRTAAATRGKKGVELIGLGNSHGMGKKWRNMLQRERTHAC